MRFKKKFGERHQASQPLVECGKAKEQKGNRGRNEILTP